ncbi:polynucleotide adenylyltransferase, partial [Gonapodya sp. JEL0774]
SGLVESRLRQLVMRLEAVDNIAIAHPFIKEFTASGPRDVAGGDGKETPIFYHSYFYIGLQVKPRDADNGAKRQLDLSWPVMEFTKMLRSWESYDPTSMDVAVVNLKSSDLPDDVFEEGQNRPAPRKKRQLQQEDQSTNGLAKTDADTKRRKHEVTVDASIPPASISTNTILSKELSSCYYAFSLLSLNSTPNLKQCARSSASHIDKLHTMGFNDPNTAIAAKSS